MYAGKWYRMKRHYRFDQFIGETMMPVTRNHASFDIKKTVCGWTISDTHTFRDRGDNWKPYVDCKGCIERLNALDGNSPEWIPLPLDISKVYRPKTRSNKDNRRVTRSEWC